MLMVGLTGGIGSGKSTAAQRFALLGVPVIDADQLAHDLVTPGQPALHEIVHVFGPQILTSSGTLNRSMLRQLVFGDTDARNSLEEILHPHIYTSMLTAIQELGNSVSYIILMVPLLLETRQTDLCQRILVVDIPEAMQIERVQLRDGHTLAEIQSILQSQWQRPQRLAAANDIIDNSADLANLLAQVDALHSRYMSLARNESQIF